MAKSFIIITPYHFGAERADEYRRLIRSLRASLRETDGRGRVILVANGTQGGAADPSKVLQDLSVSSKAQIDVIKLQDNAGSVGALNAGIEEALIRTKRGEDAWIGKVDSSAVLGQYSLNTLEARKKGRGPKRHIVLDSTSLNVVTEFVEIEKVK